MISPIETDVTGRQRGLAGLSAATIAATEGAKTLVLEAATTGGRARTARLLFQSRSTRVVSRRRGQTYA